MSKPTIIIESFQAKIEGKKLDGILAIPRISRNGNLYLPEELESWNGQTVPILWDHEGSPETINTPIKPGDIIGSLKVTYDASLMQAKYEGELTKDIPRDKPLYISLGAFPVREDRVCGAKRCYAIPRGLRLVEASITPRPGIPETSVIIHESYEGCADPKCKVCKENEDNACVQRILDAKRTAGKEIDDQDIAIAYSECGLSKESATAEIIEKWRKKYPKTENSSLKLEPTNVNQNMSAPDPAKPVTQDPAKDPERITMTPKSWEEFHNLQQKQLQALEQQNGTYKSTMEKLIETFKPKIEQVPSSTVIEPGMATMVKEAFDAAAGDLAKVLNREAKWAHWSLDKEKWLGDLSIEKLSAKKIEAVTMTAPINYDRKIIAVPGGRFRVPLRQFCDVGKTDKADRFTWFKGDSFDFAAITEGTAPSDTTVTLTQVTGTPATRGVLVKVNYSTVESAPADILSYINDRGVLAAIDDESANIMSVGTSVVTPTNWVNGNTGAEITADTTFGTTNTLTITGVAAARRLVDNQGYGLDYTLVTNPKAYFDLLISSGIDKFVQQGLPQIAATGLLETLLGCRIVVSKAAAGGDATSKRSLLLTPGQTMGLVSMRELMFEADRRNELQQIFVTPTQRIIAAALDEKSSTRVSTSA